MESESTAELSGLPYKLCVIGKSGVGKTTLIARLKDHEFIENLTPNLGISECCFTYNNYQFAIIDTAGREEYDTLTNNFFRFNDIVLLAFDIHFPVALHIFPQSVQDYQQTHSRLVRLPLIRQ